MTATTQAATEALMTLSTAMTAVVARTLGRVAGLSVPQLRVLVVLTGRGPMNLTALAGHLGVNASNASRTCERLVSEGLVERSLPPRDRRNVLLRPTDRGERLVADLLESRRAMLAQAVERMSEDDQRELVHALGALDVAMADALGGDVTRSPDGRLIPWLL